MSQNEQTPANAPQDETQLADEALESVAGGLSVEIGGGGFTGGCRPTIIVLPTIIKTIGDVKPTVVQPMPDVELS